MRKNAHARVVFGLPILVAATAVLMSAATPSNVPVDPRTLPVCAAWADDTIPVHLDRVEVTARYAEPIGEVLNAKFPDDAQIDVMSVSRPASGEPLSVLVVLNTTRAMRGKWLMTLRGDTGECAGVVYVGTTKK